MKRYNNKLYDRRINSKYAKNKDSGWPECWPGYNANDSRNSRTRKVKDERASIGYQTFRNMLEDLCNLLKPYVGVSPIIVTGIDPSSDDYKSGKYLHIETDLSDASSQVQYMFNDLDTIDSTERLVEDILEAEGEGAIKFLNLTLDSRVRDDDESEDEDESEDDDDDDKEQFVKTGKTEYEKFTRNAYQRASNSALRSSNATATCVDLIIDLRDILKTLAKAWNKDSDVWQIGTRNYYKYAADIADDVNNALSYMKKTIDGFIKIFKDAANNYKRGVERVSQRFAGIVKGNAKQYKQEAGGGFDETLYNAQGMENFGHDDNHTPSIDPLIPETDTPEGYYERNEQERQSKQEGMRKVNDVMSAGNPKKAYEVLAASEAEENSIGVEQFLKKYPWEKFYEYISDTTGYRYTKEQFEYDKDNPPDSYNRGMFKSDKAKAFRAIDNDLTYSEELKTWLENAPDIRSFVFWFYNRFGKTPLNSANDDADFVAEAKKNKVGYTRGKRSYDFTSFVSDWIFAYGVDGNIENDDASEDESETQSKNESDNRGLDEMDETIERLVQEAQAACNHINGVSSGK